MQHPANVSMSKGYKTTCPACGGHNFYVTPHNGLGYCFNCAFVRRGEERQQKPLVRSNDRDGIRSLYTQYARWCHAQLRDEHYAYLAARGLTKETVDRYLIGYCPPKLFTPLLSKEAYQSGLITKDRKPFLAGRLVIPYFTPRGDVADMRGRLYDERIAVSPTIKYLSPYGSAFFRWADIPYNVVALEHQSVVITEGEFKALASQQAGVPAVAIPGIRSLRRGLIVRPFTDVVICFDHQREHMSDIIRATIALAQHVRMYGAQVRVATLPLGDDDDKMDIDMFITRYGADSYRAIIAQAPSYDVWRRLVML